MANDVPAADPSPITWDSRCEQAYETAFRALLAERAPEGHWVGELSTSALSTAVAVAALAQVQKSTAIHGSFDPLITLGLDWLAAHQNADGGWGDTTKSVSNISTTMLCRAAFFLAGAAERYPDSRARAEAWLHSRYGTTPEQLAEAVRRRYGKDRTFSVPILMTSALAGLVAWKEVPSLPFELACFPQALFRFLRLPVVSYALPALIAIGQAVYHHRPPWNPIMRFIRWLSKSGSLRTLESIQPSNGGFLEATPLTSFVTLSLASIGQADHPVVHKAVAFIKASVLPDGSWPIDTNLSTWVTTLSINALAAASDLDKLNRLSELRDWLLRQQYKEPHPFTGAEPGAWAWTPLPGAVPDADDTPGAILALTHLAEAMNDDEKEEDIWARVMGLYWLADLQNSDGGMPTFCRGWTKLPFDRSGTDLTAHAIRAFHGSTLMLEPPRSAKLIERGFVYLGTEQRSDGSWLPLWFGNQHAPDDENPTYGTTRVLAAYRDLHRMSSEPAQRAVAWLLKNQNDDGGWGAGRGTPSSVEETALALEVLAEVEQAQPVLSRGLAWLVHEVEAGSLHQPTPIGFYFAKLWYFEKLYPIIFSVAALGRIRQCLRRKDTPSLPASDQQH